MMARPKSASIPVAVVGMSCRLPGANNVEQCWELVRAGKSSVQRLPEERFNRELLYDDEKGTLGKSYTDLACLVDYRYRPATDPICMPSTPELAYATMTQVAAEAALDAGLDGRQQLNGGVYIGHVRASDLAGDLAYATYLKQTAASLLEIPSFRQLAGPQSETIVQELVENARHRYPHRQAGGGPSLGASVPAALIAEGLGFTGRSMAFNSACASSLQALAQAVRALQLGQIELAVAGGASYCHSDTLVMFSKAQSVSATGSRPFDMDADGMIVGEGYVALILKTLESAIKDRDQVHAVIRGIGISSDGRGKSLWAPRGEGQVEAVERAYEGGLDPARLQYIEAHATSTQVGDATELAALATALRDKLPPQAKIPIGSIKANIGHTLETAGLAGLLKVILSLKHRVIPPAANVRRLNPKIDWTDAPFQVPSEASEWPEWSDKHPRRAAVNAFGIGGLNVHVVVDEYQRPSESRRPLGRVGPQLGESTKDGSEAVAIIGMGAVLPGALTIEHFAELLHSGRKAIREVPPDRWDWSAFYEPSKARPWATRAKVGGFITDFAYDWKKHKIPPKQIAQASPLQFMILDAVDQAFRQAGASHDAEAETSIRRRTGVVVGNLFGGEFAVKLMMALRLPEFRDSLREVLNQRGVCDADVDQVWEEYRRLFFAANPALLDETGSFTASSLASRITKSFNLMGGGVAVDAGMVSSGAALSCCVDQILSGDCEQMVCVAGHEDMTPVHYETWGLRGLLTSEEPRSPLDSQADGFVPAEGCAVLLLKSLSSAQRDGNQILGIVRGIGAANAPSSVESVRLAAERALRQTDLCADDVGLVESCSFTAPRFEAEELLGLDRVFGTGRRLEPLPLGSLVGQIGHLAGAAGLASVLKAALALEAKQLPGTQPFQAVHDCLGKSATNWNVSADPQPVPVVNPDGRMVAAVHCGDVSNVFHILIERGTKVERPKQSHQPRERSASSAAASSGVEEIEGIVHFDATLRRKERLRQKASTAGQRQELAVPPTSALSSAAPRPLSPTPDTQTPSNSDGQLRAIPEPDELLKFLISFVVEETGYPHEMVEMNVDLEADLGIDSIKKAQMLGEMRDSFHLNIQPSDDLSLDDFPTLQHILDFVVATTGQNSSSPAAPSAMSPALPAGGELALVRPGGSPMHPALPPPEAQVITDSDLRVFMIGFVVEETGYPDEMVEMDADLEADLGIDSIKKAQMLGEMRDRFKLKLEPSDDLSLDDFPTLQHVCDFIVRECLDATGSSHAIDVVEVPPNEVALSVRQEPAVPAVPASTVAAPALAESQVTESEMALFMVQFVVEETGYPDEMVELDADLEADLGIDSIKKAQMLGELRDQFQLNIQPSDDLSLDDFPTLRHILQYVLRVGIADPVGVGTSAPTLRSP